MAARNPSPDKRFRISLLLDTYGELLTQKQRDFLRCHYEQDFSFGEIASDNGVSRQAIFDSVKHGEASLENYERVLGLVEGGKDAVASGGSDSGANAESAARLRAICSGLEAEQGDWAGANALAAELRSIAGGLESIGAAASGARQKSSVPAKPKPQPVSSSPAKSNAPKATAPRVSAVLIKSGPEVD